MKRHFTKIIILSIVLLASSCSKEKITPIEEQQFTAVKDIPERLFTGSDFYGVWRIDSLRVLFGERWFGGSTYRGEGEVYIAFTNDGKVIVENKSKTAIIGEPLGEGKYDEQPWYFTTGQQDFKVNGFEPSNEYSTQEGKPYTGVFSFTSKNERWLSHFSGEKLTFYKLQSGDAVVTIEGTKVK